MISYTSLKAEILADPVALGYATLWSSGQDFKLAELMNTVQSNLTVHSGLIQSYLLVNAVLPSDWTGTTPIERSRFQSMVAAGQVDTANANVRTALTALFPLGTSSRSALLSLTTRTGSRAEQLFGQPVTSNDIAQARKV